MILTKEQRRDGRENEGKRAFASPSPGLLSFLSPDVCCVVLIHKWK